MRKTLATLSMAAILVAGCSVKEDNNQAEGSTISTSDQADEAAPSDDGALYADGEAMPLDIEQMHPTGTSIALESIRATPTETLVTMTINNGADFR